MLIVRNDQIVYAIPIDVDGIEETLLTMHSITFDCARPALVGQFWADALGYDVDRSEDDLASVVARDGQGPRLLFLQVPEGKSVKNRVHLDLAATDMETEVERLVNLGARTVKLYDYGSADRFMVMQDPEGNEFCVEHAPSPA